MKKKLLQFISATLVILMVALMPTTVLAESVSENDITVKSDEDSEITEEAYIDDGKSEVGQKLMQIISEKPIYALIYHTKNYALKADADTLQDTGVSLKSGTQVKILDVAFDANDNAYFKISAALNDKIVTGYVGENYIVTNDAAFNQWKSEELSKIAGVQLAAEGSSLDEIYANFPKGYWNNLIALSQAHPNWVFVPFNTGLDWNYVVASERVGNRSLVYRTVIDSWKSKDAGDYNPASGSYVPKSGPNWLRASEEAVAHCLNPINYLDEMHVFAYEQLTFNPSFQNAAGVYAIIRNSWMNERPLEDGSGGLYCDVFMEVGNATGVSPYHLASRVLQEQGINGQAALISGYGGVYNYFNVQASGATADQILATGTAYAQSQGWTTRYLSIYGGAARLGEKYITKGQDTLYLQKFDVDPTYDGLFVHQYMQNIQAPTTESNSVFKAYSDAGALENGFVFKIPIYDNMPDNYGGDAYPVSEEFIVRLYQVILDREPDDEGLAHWKNQMASGKTAADLVDLFFGSQEMLNRDLDNAAYLDYAYRAILGREADEGGKKYWLSELEAGCTRKYVLGGFVNSQEFINMCKDYGVVKGNLSASMAPADKNAGQTKFVVRLYRNIFTRDADVGGLNHWTGKLQSGMTACDLIKGFVYSTEFQNAKFSNEDYVEIMYRTLLGRDSDAAGKADWVGRLNGGQSKDAILQGFVYSPEFAKLCAEYGIVVGTL